MEKFVSLSERGKSVLVVDSVKFTKHRTLASGEISWRCADRPCKAKVYTMGPDDIITRNKMQHNHEKNVTKINRQMISATVKHEAIEQICENRAGHASIPAGRMQQKGDKVTNNLDSKA
ncbi:hypothetical protein PV328_010400 [Microctonus aethiopoides]|uniref:FLYWCH-type domain-containing protein n=1 Tax=Microctonus aethiopoides TaxID=144406 RepID=A0AA39FHR4_9HYME|nr:hypothetical protein PV328_010400 [Microctonus aethiopoides]